MIAMVDFIDPNMMNTCFLQPFSRYLLKTIFNSYANEERIMKFTIFREETLCVTLFFAINFLELP